MHPMISERVAEPVLSSRMTILYRLADLDRGIWPERAGTRRVRRHSP
jgi:hypothetical protein